MHPIIKASPPKTRRKFDETFKGEAVRNWLNSGGGGGRRPTASDLHAQLEVAQREIRNLREQRDILKKALGILSEPPSSASPGSTR